MKIAVIGSGISGNVIASKLCALHDITVFERNTHFGGHSHTHLVETPSGPQHIDSGFIVFNYQTYPNFTKLLSELGVEVQKSIMSFSVSCKSTNFEYMGSNLNTLFSQRRNLIRPSFWKFLLEINRFNSSAKSTLKSEENFDTLRHFLDKEKFSNEFQRLYLIPMAASVWSADHRRILDFPARSLFKFLSNHGLLNISNRPTWHVIQGGSKTYVEALTKPFKNRIKLSTEVVKIERKLSKVLVESTVGKEEFDYVFMACHSDDALALLKDPSAAEKSILGSIKYRKNKAILHTDSSLMPNRKRAWAAWNYHMLDEGPGPVALTYNMNILQGLKGKTQYCVTLNNENAINANLILKEMEYSHPEFTSEALSAQSRIDELNGKRRTFYAGAYWGYGFHEDGVLSALNAVNCFNNSSIPDADIP